MNSIFKQWVKWWHIGCKVIEHPLVSRIFSSAYYNCQRKGGMQRKSKSYYSAEDFMYDFE